MCWLVGVLLGWLGWLWLVVVGCGWLWLVVVGCGWLWLVVVGCGWLWLVVVGCGWLWLVVVGCGWLWLVVVGCGWLWLVVVVVVVLVVVECLYSSERIIIVRWADLSDFFVDFRRKNVYVCFTSNENCHFSSEKRLHPKTGC